MGNISITELIRHVTRILLSESDIDRGVNQSLEVLQGATKVDRVYIFEMWQDDKRGNMARQIFEFCAPGVPPEIDNPLLLDLEMDQYFNRWVETFKRDSWVSGHIDDFPEIERGVLAEQGILSLLVIPIKVENGLVGFMGFDSTSVKRDWRLQEVELLIETSVLIGTLLMRRRQEARLLAEELKYSNLFQNMSDGVVYHNQTGRITQYNDAACNILGLNPGQLLGITSLDSNWKVVNEEGQELEEKDHPSMIALRTGKVIKDVTMGVFNSSRDFNRWILATAIPEINTATHQIEGVYVIFKDISTRIHYENELKQAKRTAEDVSRLKSSIMANIGHEFRTPITGILGFSNLIAEQSDNHRIQDAARFIGMSANRLHHTLESLLEYSYLDSNSIDFRPRHIILSSILRSVIEEAKQQAETKNLDFGFQLIGDDLVYCDDRFLKTIVRQLLSNAIKFTESGSINFTLATSDESFIMTVQDTGIGISADYYTQLFEPFVQASDGIGRGFEGSGLGLPIVKRLVETLKGKIDVNSNSESGTTFVVTIPRDTPSDSGKSAQNVQRQIPQSTSIIYIEDNPVLRKLIKSMLPDFDVTTVSTAEEALVAIEMNSFGVYLIDINLGTGMNGVDLARKIRTTFPSSDVILVAITAYSLDQLAEAGGGDGLFDHYISKPFMPEDVVSVVQTCVGRLKQA